MPVRRLSLSGLLLLAPVLACALPIETGEEGTVKQIFLTKESGGELRDPEQATTTFGVDDAVVAVVELWGRPEEGTVEFAIRHADNRLGERTWDLAERARGPGGGRSMQVFWTVHRTVQGQRRPWWVGTRYAFEISVDGGPTQTFPFTVTPPAGATPSRVEAVELGRGSTPAFQIVNPTTTFGRMEPVHVVVRGDFGRMSWLEARVSQNGREFEDQRPSYIFEEDQPGSGFRGVFRPPAQGWPPGSYEARLILDDNDVGTYAFTITG